MSTCLFVAALLAIAIAVAHSCLGEKYLIVRLLRRDHLPRLLGSDTFTKQTIRFAWHLTTVAWCGLAAILLVVAGLPIRINVGDALLLAISGTFFTSAILSLTLTRGRHLSWIVFLAISVLCAIHLL